MKRSWRYQNGRVARPTLNKKVLFASFCIALGLVLMVVALNISVTGDKNRQLPVAIQSIDPVRDATQILSQAKVFVDLQSGYTGTLTINGVEMTTIGIDTVDRPAPGKQITLPPGAIFEPGNNTLSYQPADGAPIKAFDTGVNTAIVRYWKILDGPNKARSFTWTFTVI